MVVADSSAWIGYFRSPESSIGREVASLIVSNEMAVVGIVMAEVLQGARSPAEFDFLRTPLDTPGFLDDDKDTWLWPDNWQTDSGIGAERFPCPM